MDLTSLYHTAIEQTYDDDHAAIVGTFRDLLKQGKKEIKLINYFYGMPLLYPATMISIDRGSLDLDINSQQAVAIAQDRFTFIRCNAFKRDIGAHVQYVNVRKHAVTLGRFFYVEIMAERRSSLRLDLVPPAEAILMLGNEELHGKLLDLSVGGAATRLEGFPSTESGFEATIRFNLPNLLDNSSITVQTSVRHVATLERDGGPIFQMAMAPDKLVERQISQYLFQRQVEIIRELKEAAL